MIAGGQRNLHDAARHARQQPSRPGHAPGDVLVREAPSGRSGQPERLPLLRGQGTPIYLCASMPLNHRSCASLIVFCRSPVAYTEARTEDATLSEDLCAQLSMSFTGLLSTLWGMGDMMQLCLKI